MATSIQGFIDTPLLAAPTHLDRTAVIDAGGAWTWREVHAASLALAARLEGTATLCNLCDSHVGFLVAWLAALRRGCLQLLPPSGGRADLLAMLKSSVNPLVVVDSPQALEQPWHDHARCLFHRPERESTRTSDPALAWSPNWDEPLVRLHTSGSTGTPTPQVKTLGQLARGAQVLGARLDQDIDGGLTTLRQFVCSVPPQHMFGLETSIMMSVIHGIPVLDRRPLLTADVHAAFETCKNGAAWIATPLHLRALVKSREILRHCRAVIVSTMPLAHALAAEAESLINAPILEIYGSTETGALAMRRTARETQWRPLQGVEFKSTTHGALVSSTHFSSPQALADRIELQSNGEFKLRGRQSDLIKIGGRRASLDGLNLLLIDLPGLVDGVFYMPGTGAPTERLALIYTGAPLDRAATEAWLRARMDPVFLPRAIIRVDHLPRTKLGKIPRAALHDLYASWLASKAAR